MAESKDAWPSEMYDEDEWPELIRKPDSIYLPGGLMYTNLSTAPVCLGQFGETEINFKRKGDD
jgi:hypothetical protein